jgi:two-component system NtrC family sensor kinase
MRPEPKPNPYVRLRGQMQVVLLVFGLVPLFAMGFAGFVANQESIETRTRNVLEAMVKNRKVTVELFLEEKMRELELAASSQSAEELGRSAVLESLRDKMRGEHGGIVDLGLIDDAGRHTAYVGPYPLLGQDYGQQPWFEQVRVLGRYESDVFLGLRRFPHMVMAVRKREAGRDCILRATIDTDLLSALVREGGLESGADVFILNRAGEYQTQYLDRHRLMEKADIGPVPLHSGVRMVEIARGGRSELVATAWLRRDSWVLVARQQVPHITSLLWAHPAVMWVFAFGLVLVPVMSVLVARHRLRQFRSLETERAARYESVAQTQKTAAIGRLAATVAHEINNPLAVIQAQVGVLADSLADADEQLDADDFKQRLEKIEAQVERGRKVTHRLLGFSRRIGPDLEPVDVQGALEEAVGFVEKEALASGVRFVRRYDADVPMIRSSLAQMQQVFLNLVNNAVDALSGGGEVALHIRRQQGGVEVQVADNGPGIASKDLGRIFAPSFSTKSGKKHNTGLGLAICRETMNNLGGKIEVESEPAKGTTFTLWFPLEVEPSTGAME